jgi:hypothetical protein
MTSDASPGFVDPRVHPDPPCRRPAAGVASVVEDLDALHQACREGRLYDVEAWIQAGRPLQLDPEAGARARRRPSALAIALETGQHALVLLLLCNGYLLDPPGCPFDLALKARRWDLVDLLWAWGADPTAVDACTLFETYTTPLFERFYAAGADLTRDHELAGTLAYHTSNRPLFGFAKRHRATDPKIQMELNIALAQHVDEENLKGVHLCLWAGADPHAPAPDLRTTHWLEEEDEDDEEHFIGWSAVERAVIFGKRDLLPVLKPDPTRDNFEKLYQSAQDAPTVDLLAALAPPSNVGAILRDQCHYLDPRWPSTGHYPIAVLEEVFKTGARWTESPADEIAWIRRDLLKAKDHDFVELVKLLTHDDYCSTTVLQELARTPNFRKRLVQVGLIPTPRVLDGRRSESYRMAGYRNVLTKLGIAVPKPKTPLGVHR